MHWDNTISAGHIVSAISLVVTLIAMYIRAEKLLAARLSALETKMNILFAWFQRNILSGKISEMDQQMINQFHGKKGTAE